MNHDPIPPISPLSGGNGLGIMGSWALAEDGLAIRVESFHD